MVPAARALAIRPCAVAGSLATVTQVQARPQRWPAPQPSVPSQASPGSRTPSPQNGAAASGPGAGAASPGATIGAPSDFGAAPPEPQAGKPTSGANPTPRRPPLI